MQKARGYYGLALILSLLAIILTPVYGADIRAQAQAGSEHLIYLPVVMRHYDGVIAPSGVESSGWTEGNAADLASQLADVGAVWTRYNSLQWSAVEPVRGAGYSWAYYDTLLKGMVSRGQRLVLIISNNPEWARADPNAVSGVIKDDQKDNALPDFVAFVRAAVERYGKAPYNVKYWELYNEPDSIWTSYGGVIGSWGGHGDKYAAMLKAVYPAIKEVDPEAQVVFGGLAFSNFYDQERCPNCPFDRNFLGDSLQNGALGNFDIFNFHYYAVQNGEWSNWGRDIIGKVNYLRQTYGLQNVPMICSEVGEFGPPDDEAQLELQAQYVPKVYARGMSAGLGSIVWYSLHEGTNDTGLVHNGVPKPAYAVYKAMAAEMTGARFARQLTAADVGLADGSARYFEGYAFRTVSGGKQIWVVWLNDDTDSANTPVVNISVRTRNLVEVDKAGNRVSHSAGADGVVSITLGTSPVYLEMPE